MLQAIAAHLLAVPSSTWHEILVRKEKIAFCQKNRWLIHTDADEVRQSTFQPYNLADSLALVEADCENSRNTLRTYRFDLTGTSLEVCTVD